MDVKVLLPVAEVYNREAVIQVDKYLFDCKQKIQCVSVCVCKKADTCKVRQAPGEQRLIIWRQGGPTGEDRGGGGGGGGEGGGLRGVIFPTVASDP